MRVRKSFQESWKKLLTALVVVSMLVTALPNIAVQANPVQYGYGHETTWESGPGVVQIATSGRHTVALRGDGTLWAWGTKDHGANLGDGFTTQSLSPIQVAADYYWVYVAVCENLTVAIQADGSVWMWGSSPWGWGHQPTPVRVSPDYGWASISIYHGQALLIREDGSLWAQWDVWNWMNHGAQPSRVGMSYDWQSVSFDRHTARGIKIDGSLWAWGDNFHGQIGCGTNVPYRPEPTQIGVDGIFNLGPPGPHGPMWTLVDWIATDGADFSAAVAADHTLWAWGWADSVDHYGYPTSINNMPILIDDSHGWADVVVHGNSGTALRLDGSLWRFGLEPPWGSPSGPYMTMSWPPQLLWHQGRAISLMSGGRDNDSVFVMNDDGSIWAMGCNMFGQLGNGTTHGNHHSQSVMIRPAPTAPTLYVGRVADYGWSHVDVPVILHNNPGIAGFNITITYDTNIVSPVDLNDEDIRRDLGGSVFVSNIDRNAGTITAVWAAAADVYTEYLFSIGFQTLVGGRVSTPINVTIEELKCLNHESVDAYTQNGSITIFNMPGANVVMGAAVGQMGDNVLVPVWVRDQTGGANAGGTLVIAFEDEILTPRNVIGGSWSPTQIWSWCHYTHEQYYRPGMVIHWWGDFAIEFEINPFLLGANEVRRSSLEIHHLSLNFGGPVHGRNGSVLVYPGGPLLWGDVNLDGVVDIHDLVRLAQHIARVPGMELVDLGLLLSDVFFDGHTNLSDLIHLARFLASPDPNNPDVILGPGSTQ